jgi:phosphatidylserine/phosphatidylglycerophosphate/cardiolipin synthase-like enzyme
MITNNPANYCQVVHLVDIAIDEVAFVQPEVIVTNSLRSCDGALPFAGYIKYRRRMVRDGIDLREYRGPDTLHAKTLVIDGRTALVGSYNIDPRSHNLDTEVMCVANDETIARQLLASIDRHIDNAWSVTVTSGTPSRRARGVSAHGRRGWYCRCWRGSCKRLRRVIGCRLSVRKRKPTDNR